VHLLTLLPIHAVAGWIVVLPLIFGLRMRRFIDTGWFQFSKSEKFVYSLIQIILLLAAAVFPWLIYGALTLLNNHFSGPAGVFLATVMFVPAIVNFIHSLKKWRLCDAETWK
jgi:hypothetical protein